jgi:hypothetical protein
MEQHRHAFVKCGSDMSRACAEHACAKAGAPVLPVLPACVLPGGFIKTIIRVLRCVGHFNSKLLVDKVL